MSLKYTGAQVLIPAIHTYVPIARILASAALDVLDKLQSDWVG